ncbi:MAG: PEP-CTERM sorting domain-containing protein [Acidobacteria bacterium]|nr:PEP-CTERM sorting domain-containing protein [Acidobacteriota bacterium]
MTAAAPLGRSSVITTGCANVNISCTFAELLTGATIQTNDLVFSGFTRIHILGFGYAQIPDLRNIIVYGLDNGGLDPGPGLLFDLGGQWDLGPRGLIDYETTFGVTSIGNVIKDSSVDLGPNTFADGENSAAGAEDYLFEYAGGPAVYRLVADIRPSEAFNEPSVDADIGEYTSLFALLSFRAWAGDSDSGSANLDSFTLRFSQLETITSVVPEPSSWALLLAGLGLAGRLRRKRKSHS